MLGPVQEHVRMVPPVEWIHVMGRVELFERLLVRSIEAYLLST